MMKKTISLILAIVMSMTIFLSDIAGITMIVRAEDFTEEAQDAVPDPEGVPDPSADPAPAPEQQDPVEPSQDPDAGQEVNPGPSEDEAAKQAAYEQAAKEAEEAAKKAAEDAAAQEAQRQAEEAAAKAAKEAEDAAKAAEEQKKKEQDQNYSLSAMVGSQTVTSVSFGSAVVGSQRDYVGLRITNVGANDVDLIYTKANDADGAFSISLHSANTHLGPGESAMFNVSMGSDLSVGKYKANLLFGDAKKDPNYSKALSVSVSGEVTQKKEVVTDVDVSPSKITLATGGSCQFKAVASGNTDLVYAYRWSVAGNNSGGTKISDDGLLTIAGDETAATVTVIATTTIPDSAKGTAIVTIQRNSYNVNAYADPANGGNVTGGGAVVQGGSVTLSAVPSKNFYFDGWVVNGSVVSKDTNYTISNVNQNMNVTAKFAQNYVTVTAVPNNSNAGNVVGGGTITYGGSTTLSAKAYDGYVFTGWKEGDQTVSKDASIKLSNLTVDRKFTAMFEKTKHTLTLACDPNEGGTVSGGGTFKLNEGTTIKAKPNDGYKFLGWQVNGQYVSRDAEYKIDKVKHDYTCTAMFMKNTVTTYEMSAGVATTGGSISPSGKFVIAQGGSLTYTITPKSGFAILAVAVDGAMVGPVSTYTFNNIQGPHMIAAAFVQTDAGKKAAQSSGKVTQQEKVKTLPKTLNNTATTTSTVDLDAAASGEGGDEYVEEMDLTQVSIPTDEQLGVTDEPEETSEVTQFLGKSMAEVDEMIQQGNTMPVLDAAFMTGGLGAFVYNKYEPADLISVDYNKMTRDELMQIPADEINPSLPDLDIVVQKMLSVDDVTKLAKGERMDISVSITGQETPNEADEKIMKNAIGKKPLKYFDVTMLKSVDGYTEKITELPTTMEVVIEVPDDIYKSGREYSVLRVHNGELAVLPDLDDNPKTITFRTDRFSSYAIAEQVASTNGIIGWLVGGAALALGVAITCFLILVAHQRKVRRMKRAAAHRPHNE